MQSIISVAFLVATARALDRHSCSDYCNALQSGGRDVITRPECLCFFDHKINKHRIQHRTPDTYPVIDDSAIYYEPSRVYHHPRISFVQQPFHIINPTLHKPNFAKRESKKAEEIGVYNQSNSATSAHTNPKENIIQKTNIEAEEIPVYLDIDIHKTVPNERSSSKESSEKYDLQLSEDDLIQCIDLHILIYSRNSDMDMDLVDIWDPKKLSKYKTLSDSDLSIEIEKKCRQPANVVKQSQQEITVSRPRKTEHKSSQDNSKEYVTNAPVTDDTKGEPSRHIGGAMQNILNRDVSETPTFTECTTMKAYIEKVVTNNISTKIRRNDDNSTIAHSTNESNDINYTNNIGNKFYSATSYPNSDLVKLDSSKADEFILAPTRETVDGGVTTESDFYSVQKEMLATLGKNDNNNYSATISDHFIDTAENNLKDAFDLTLNGTVSTLFNTNSTSTTDKDLESTDIDHIMHTSDFEYTTQRNSHLASNVKKYQNNVIPENIENNVLYETENSNDVNLDFMTAGKSNWASTAMPSEQKETVPSLIRSADKPKSDNFMTDADSESSTLGHIPEHISNTPHSHKTLKPDEKEIFKVTAQDENIFDGPDLTSTTPLYWTSNATSTTSTSSASEKETDIINTKYTTNTNDSSTNLPSADSSLHYIVKDVTSLYSDITEEKGKDKILDKTLKQILMSSASPIDIITAEGSTGYTEHDNNIYVSKSTFLPDLSLITGKKQLQTQPISTTSYDSLLINTDITFEHFTTESIQNSHYNAGTEYPHVSSSKDGGGRTIFPEKEIEIPKIITKELYNGTVVSDVNGTESIPNNDFTDDLLNSESSHNETMLNLITEPVAIPSKIESILNANTTENNSTQNLVLSRTGEDIVGKLYFLFSDKLVPARFIQDADGQIKLGIDGETLCDKLLKKQNDSVIMATLCRPPQSV